MAIVAADLRLLDCNSCFFKAFHNDGRSCDPAQLERYLDEAELWQITELVEQFQAGQNKPEKRIDLAGGRPQNSA